MIKLTDGLFGAKATCEQPGVADLRSNRRECFGGSLPAQFVYVSEQWRIRTQRGENLEQQRELPVFTQDRGREVFQGAVLVDEPRRACPADALDPRIAVGRVPDERKEVGDA